MAITKKKTPPPASARTPKPAGSGPSSHRPHELAIGFEELKALIGLVAKEAIDDFEFQSGDVKFHIRKGSLVSAQSAPQPQAAATLPPMPPPPAHTLVAAAQPASEPADDPSIHHITSPIVGTFYRSPTANGAPYVQPGDYVKPGQTMCIVEAMKLMNEIECDVAGELLAVLVENGQPVEYGERLFSVRIR